MKDKTHRVALIDPPWQQMSGEKHYSTLPLERIKQLGIALEEHMADDSVCALWVTNTLVPEGRQVLDSFGYRFMSMVTWAKDRKGFGTPFRNSTEQLLVGFKGRPSVRFRNQGTLLFAPLQDHSHKPEEIHVILERMFDGPFLEIFARRPRPGWHVWGNEVRSDIDLIDWPVPDAPATRSRTDVS
jgi:N6-adenosine-specific RNA methylase IME4